MKVLSCVVLSILMMTSQAYAQGCDLFYTTKSGDTLSSIANEFYGDKQQWRLIREVNSSNAAIKTKAMPIDLQLYIPCISDHDDLPTLIADNEEPESLLDQLLGDGITNKSKTTQQKNKAVEDSRSDEASKNVNSLSSESKAVLEDILGKDIIKKKPFEQSESEAEELGQDQNISTTGGLETDDEEKTADQVNPTDINVEPNSVNGNESEPVQQSVSDTDSSSPKEIDTDVLEKIKNFGGPNQKTTESNLKAAAKAIAEAEAKVEAQALAKAEAKAKGRGGSNRKG